MMAKWRRALGFCLAAALSAVPGLAFSANSGPSIDTQARYAYIVDFATGAVLLDKNGEQSMPPASMSKIMTAYLVYEALKKGKLALDDILPVSEKAWRTGGSKMFVPYPGRVKVEDLIRGLIVQSGNDACIVLAEGIAGSEEAFVEQMNEKAKQLGLTDSHFTNVTGLPDPEEHMTARDLAMLARHLITDFPEYYHYDSEKDFTFNKIRQGNRNPLLYKDLGADGLKTGHTDEAGYGLTASAIRDGRRIIMVLSGMDKMNTRAQESERLLDWAFREFSDYRLFKKGDVIDQADVWLGSDPKVAVTTPTDIVVTLPRAARRSLKVVAHYDHPARAPVVQGAALGKLTVSADGVDPVDFPLVSAQAVPKLGPLGRVAVSAGYLLWGNR